MAIKRQKVVHKCYWFPQSSYDYTFTVWRLFHSKMKMFKSICACFLRFNGFESFSWPVWTSVSRFLLAHRKPIFQSKDALPDHLHLHTDPRHHRNVTRQCPLPHLPAPTLPRLHPEPKWTLPEQQHTLSLLRCLVRLVPILNGPGRRPLADPDDAALYERLHGYEHRQPQSPHPGRRRWGSRRGR